MSFKDELEEILRRTAKYDRAVDGDYMAAHFENKALTSIINLVDKELPKKRATLNKENYFLAEGTFITEIGGGIYRAEDWGYNQAIDDMRAKLKEDK